MCLCVCGSLARVRGHTVCVRAHKSSAAHISNNRPPAQGAQRQENEEEGSDAGLATPASTLHPTSRTKPDHAQIPCFLLPIGNASARAGKSLSPYGTRERVKYALICICACICMYVCTCVCVCVCVSHHHHHHHPSDQCIHIHVQTGIHTLSPPLSLSLPQSLSLSLSSLSLSLSLSLSSHTHTGAMKLSQSLAKMSPRQDRGGVSGMHKCQKRPIHMAKGTCS